MHRLLRGTALAIDGDRRHAERQAGRQHAVSADMQSLLARLGNTTNDDVVHSFAAGNKLGEGTRGDIRKLFAASDRASYAGSQTTGELKANLALLKEVFSALK